MDNLYEEHKSKWNKNDYV